MINNLNNLDSINKLNRDGYNLLPNFISNSDIDKILKRLYELENNTQNYQPAVLDRPMVTLFVAGYKNEQIIVDLEDFKELKDVLNKISIDVKNKLNPHQLYVYEITIFKKKKGSPALFLHQDAWYHPFALSSNLFEYFSYYIPLTPFVGESSLLGLVTLNNIDINIAYKPRHIISGLPIVENDNSQAMLNLEEKIKYPEMNSGDCMIFEIRTPHNSREHDVDDIRYALSVRLSTVNPVINKLELSHANFVEQLKLYGKKVFLKLF
jgi:hypothetical protein